MTKMKIAPGDRAKVKSECLRLLLTLKLDPARSELIWTFAESYLTLSAQETKQYEREIAKLPQEDQEKTIFSITRFRRRKKWAGRIENGELLDRAEAAGFDVLLTTYKNIHYQQKM